MIVNDDFDFDFDDEDVETILTALQEVNEVLRDGIDAINAVANAQMRLTACLRRAGVGPS